MISTISNETTSARKRRLQIIQSQRNVKNEDLVPPQKKKREPITSSVAARQKVSDDQTLADESKKGKKPQMRYDPDVPMSKEEAAKWRREQRRKRNRESAAASRQRQRDRIAELEEEVSEWKAKYEEAIARIEKLEQLSSKKECSIASTPRSATPESATGVSPFSSPRQSPSLSYASDSSCGVVSLQDQSSCSEAEMTIASNGLREQGKHVKHLSEKISRPA